MTHHLCVSRFVTSMVTNNHVKRIPTQAMRKNAATDLEHQPHVVLRKIALVVQVVSFECIWSNMHRLKSTIHRVGSSIHRSGSTIHRLGGTIHRLGSTIHRSGSNIHRSGRTIHRSGSNIHRSGSVIPRQGSRKYSGYDTRKITRVSRCLVSSEPHSSDKLEKFSF